MKATIWSPQGISLPTLTRAKTFISNVRDTIVFHGVCYVTLNGTALVALMRLNVPELVVQDNLGVTTLTHVYHQTAYVIT